MEARDKLPGSCLVQLRVCEVVKQKQTLTTSISQKGPEDSGPLAQWGGFDGIQTE